MSNDNITELVTQGVILEDWKHGKKYPWHPNKVKSMKLADSFKRLSLKESDVEGRVKLVKKSQRVRFCSHELKFLREIDVETGELGEIHLQEAHFCRERLCPQCQKRVSMKTFTQVSQVADEVQRRYPELVPIFLTLTLRNCSESELYNFVGEILSKGWFRLTHHTKIIRVVSGWFRALELTYNHKDKTFHPHLHAILLVDKQYFKGADYMTTWEWVRLWRAAMRLDYDPVCDIRKLRNSKHKQIAEVAKYTLRDVDFLGKGISNKNRDRLVDVLSKALKGRRLYAFGGVMKAIAKELELGEVGEGDLIHINENAIREDIATVIEEYHWNFGIANYIKV